MLRHIPRLRPPPQRRERVMTLPPRSLFPLTPERYTSRIRPYSFIFLADIPTSAGIFPPPRHLLAQGGSGGGSYFRMGVQTFYQEPLYLSGRRGVFDHPAQVFADIQKTAAQSTAVFDTPVYTSFPHKL